MEQTPKIEIWLAHQPMEQNQNDFPFLGNVTLDDRLLEIMKPVQLKQNDTLLFLSTLKHSSASGLQSRYGIKSGEFRYHYALNRNPGNREHLNAVSGLDLETRRNLATSAGVLPLTTLSITLTRDEYMVIGERNTANVITTGLQPMPSGFANTSENDTRGTPSTFGNIYNEFFEELFLVQKLPESWVNELKGYYANEIAGIAPLSSRQYLLEMIMAGSAPSKYTAEEVEEHIGRVMLHGLTYSDNENRGFANIFSIESKLSSREVQDIFEMNLCLWKDAIREVNGYKRIPFTADAVESFLREYFTASEENNQEQINNHSIAGILLVAKNMLDNGERWYRSMMNSLAKTYPSQTDRIFQMPEGYFEIERNVPETIFTKRSYLQNL